VWILDQQSDSVADEVGRGFISHGEQQCQLRDRAGSTEPITIYLSSGQSCDDIVTGAGSSVIRLS
jgi:hypothetical protein